MANRINFARGTSAELQEKILSAGEPAFIDNKTLYIGTGTENISINSASGLKTIHLSGAGAVDITSEHFGSMVHVEAGTSIALAKSDFTVDGSFYIQNHSGVQLPVNFTAFDGLYDAGNQEDLTAISTTTLEYLEIMMVIITENGGSIYLNFTKHNNSEVTQSELDAGLNSKLGIAESPSVLNWLASTSVKINEIRRVLTAVGSFQIGDIVRSNSARTTTATFDATEAGNWTLVASAGNLRVILVSTIDANSTALLDNVIYVSNSTSALTNAPAEFADWAWTLVNYKMGAFRTQFLSGGSNKQYTRSAVTFTNNTWTRTYPIADGTFDTKNAVLKSLSVTGGGTISVSATGYVKNSIRFMAMNNGRGTHFGTGGYFDMIIPTSGTITGVMGATDVTATTDGVPLANFQSLYYILPIGSGSSSVVGNFRVASYTSDFVVPETWIKVCSKNGDAADSGFYFANGVRLRFGESITMSSFSDAKPPSPLEVAKIADYNVLATDKYTNFTNTSATGLVNFTLNSATEGFKLSFYISVAQELRVTGTINVNGVSVTNLRASTIGNYLSLEVRNGIWVMVGMTGTWADA